MLTYPEDGGPNLVVPGIAPDLPGPGELFDNMRNSRSKEGIHPVGDTGTPVLKKLLVCKRGALSGGEHGGRDRQDRSDQDRSKNHGSTAGAGNHITMDSSEAHLVRGN